ncbi:MAG: cation transporter [Clostridia bacterium]|nr:cation transporter [Clostridia bacterium]
MKYKFRISGVDCPTCAAKLSEMMSEEKGIESAKINFLTEKLTVESELDEAETLSVLSATARSFSKSVKIEK